jgi:hypothetical protein
MGFFMFGSLPLMILGFWRAMKKSKAWVVAIAGLPCGSR